MNAYLLPGLLGLALGLTLRWAGFSRPEALRDTLALRRSHALRSSLTALGWSMLLTAALCWLAVIDVDRIEVLPVSGSVVAGGVLFGAAAGLCGFTPTAALAGVGGPCAAEALCTAAGCLTATLLLPALSGPLSALQSAGPSASFTLFRMTLDEPWLLEGGFLGQGCAGLLLISIAVCLPGPRIMQEPEPLPAGAAEENAAAPQPGKEQPVNDTEPVVPDEVSAPAEDASSDRPLSAPVPDPPLPSDAAEETFVALLPGEEPLIIDTAPDAPEEAPDPADGPSADGPEEPAAPD